LKVLLVNPQYTEGYIHSARWDSISYSNTHWYPIFLAYCTSLLEEHGHQCKLVDAEAEDLSDSQVIEIANKFKPDFTLIYASERGLDSNIALAKSIKADTSSQIIFAGPWCSFMKDSVEESTVDFLIDGEFEFATLDIVEGRQKKKGYLKTERLTSKQINELGWVTKVYKKHLKIDRYRVSSIRHPYVDIFTSRKCYWGKCAFCLWPATIQGEGGYEERDIGDVLNEIEWAWKNLPIKEIFIQDDTIAPRRARELSEGLISRGMKISWACYARGDMALSQEIIDLMARSGCRVVHIGYESGNDEILGRMKKGVTVESLREVTKRFNNAKISVHGDFMVGNEGESKKTIQQTFDFIRSLDGLDIVQIAPPKLYHNCQLYKWYADNKEGAYIDEKGLPNLKDMTYEDLVKECKRGLRGFYTSRKFIFRVLTRPSLLKQVLGSAIPAITFIFGKRPVEVPVR
jgi:anaerobic magnesium-protoporphyrin IX monomethyl ester cyclase